MYEQLTFVTQHANEPQCDLGRSNTKGVSAVSAPHCSKSHAVYQQLGFTQHHPASLILEFELGWEQHMLPYTPSDVACDACIVALPANGGINLTHHAKIDVCQLAISKLEQIARVRIRMVVPLL